MFKGDRLKSLRKERNITQKYLAEKLLFYKGNISRYETGIRQPDLGLVIKMANYFNVTTDYLLGLSNLPKNFYVRDEQKNYYYIDIKEQYLQLAKKLQDNNIDPKAVESIIPALQKLKE
ncbi:helix-turn-helix transcriptional regulator [Clostridium sp. 'deep sea']|uniref:helix-turn-helix domain-containing protein n=1 Tax=Clostridium sp. 'deep sea' TaxID=2779445 RepID=UPI0018965F87|nr:helix-turn-helix transcriptional regulator [Clostridium sp. 'deep sea']QOR36294.1 helix-turn-helix transcriptional regulator [Clostridium sp. 'deep sea']